MAGIDMGKQVGPLPMGAWFAVIAGGLGIALWSRQNQKTTPVVVEDTSGQAGVGVGAGFYNAVQLPMQDNTPAAPVTNEEWAVKAINYLIAQGYDPAVADTAIRKYLESTPLSLMEVAMVRIALVKWGSPPVPLPIPPPIPTIPKPVTPAPPPPRPAPVPAPVPPRPQLRYIIVQPWPSRYSNLSWIAEKVYGRKDQWRRLYDANRKGIIRPDGTPGFISNPDYLRPGDRIYAP